MKTQKISGNVTNIQLESEALCLEFSESYPYYWIENRSANEVLISLEKEPVKGSDGSYSVSAGSNIRVSGGFDRKLVLLGSGEVQVIASVIAECPFKSAAKGGDTDRLSMGVYHGERIINDVLIGSIYEEE